MYRAFIASRTAAIPANDHICTACPAVAHLDLKVILHRGLTVRQAVGSSSDLLGPAVTVAHRLLKNTVRDRIGFRPYLYLTEPRRRRSACRRSAWPTPRSTRTPDASTGGSSSSATRRRATPGDRRGARLAAAPAAPVVID